MGDTLKEPIIFAPKTYQYDKFQLNPEDMAEDPIEQFTKWFQEAQEAREDLPEAVNLATARLPSGRVSSRVVLFKELDDRGFVIYSNWEQSKKGQDVKSNKYAAITFFWKGLQRQVRVEGVFEAVSRSTVQRYFDTRPRGSRLGAWASPQSVEIPSRAALESNLEAIESQFRDSVSVPVPDHWGGQRLVPLEIEFWQGRPSRLHDRLVYRRENLEDNKWSIVRIAP
ncbi:Pyridoxine phosphate oxidase [Komagataella phaffii CBS 7435]|uniref:pyridoxal 5'-phosphate synthase n=2 Tax=Komagataella phaffii TaxID=460519 RepID=C4QX52_KOMPG|nr:uncharacterized protein PAS_chr1-1_0448 [Komagataella phaffii GS115]AOA60535.1 GQ67_02198T0 [Komagataella phaffii]CAH2446625.1 Pyridoxine phosphate oxidase [Komagataella phaffii CBS 7435]AOA65483.1 GQ68_02213T0 [Komagataella phaffii GS115]CAY67825.1 Pyridoxine (pyridoxamine) phosphate oxidase, has homologs in E. coli and Myxococcus xanthus [Komagataella phaffii GS115]CCA36907.1 Pyridoxine phosphate oxidase [Komagataella phaffii CBS 7435]